MRKLLINVAAFVASAHVWPFTVSQWQYWACLGLLVVIQVNNAIDD